MRSLVYVGARLETGPVRVRSLETERQMKDSKRARASLPRVFRFCALALAAGVLPAFSAPMWGTPAELDGWRSTGGGGLSGSGGYLEGVFTVAWSITLPNRDGLWLYSYTLTAPDVHGGGIGHAIFGLAPETCFSVVVPRSPCVLDGGGKPIGEIDVYAPGEFGNSNPGLPNEIIGVKFDAGGSEDLHSVTLEFYSPNAPVWGDFYAKGGQGEAGVWNAVWNNGIGAVTTASVGGFTSNDFIARPGGFTDEHPEPASIALVGGGMLALAYGLRNAVISPR